MTSAAAPVIDADAARALLAPLTALAALAGEAILAVDRTRMTTQGKLDGSPVTEADLAADRILTAGLRRHAPATPIVSEESVHGADEALPASFFLVDPLDGTKEFIAGHDDYTVNIALVTQGRPLLGIVCAPALGLIWRGVVGAGAQRLAWPPGESAAHTIGTRAWPGEGCVAAVSRSHLDARTEAFIAGLGPGQRRQIGSALKFCRVAEGSADIYPRLSAISEWDIAAGHAVVEAAGGRVTDASGAALRFGDRRPDFSVRDFVAWGDPEKAARYFASPRR
jgi:3'(2'), 5'-bisphosphate nucleotidase